MYRPSVCTHLPEVSEQLSSNWFPKTEKHLWIGTRYASSGLSHDFQYSDHQEETDEYLSEKLKFYVKFICCTVVKEHHLTIVVHLNKWCKTSKISTLSVWLSYGLTKIIRYYVTTHLDQINLLEKFGVYRTAG